MWEFLCSHTQLVGLVIIDGVHINTKRRLVLQRIIERTDEEIQDVRLVGLFIAISQF